MRIVNSLRIHTPQADFLIAFHDRQGEQIRGRACEYFPKLVHEFILGEHNTVPNFWMYPLHIYRTLQPTQVPHITAKGPSTSLAPCQLLLQVGHRMDFKPPVNSWVTITPT